MTNLVAAPALTPVVQLETTDAALAGAGQKMNLQAQALLNQVTYVLNLFAGLATVANSGSYPDLINKPAFGTAAFTSASAFATAAQGAKADGAAQTSSLAAVAFSGAYSDLSGKPFASDAPSDTNTYGRRAGAWVIVAGAALINPMTAVGDMIIGDTGGNPIRLALGANNFAPVSNGTTLVNKHVAVVTDANVFTNQQAVTPYRANISGAVSIDLAATAKSNNLHLTLTGNVSSFALTNPVDGAVYNIRFIQDATGGRTMPALPSAFKFAGGTAPTFSSAANAWDFLSAEWGATESSYAACFNKGMA